MERNCANELNNSRQDFILDIRFRGAIERKHPKAGSGPVSANCRPSPTWMGGRWLTRGEGKGLTARIGRGYFEPEAGRAD